MKRRSYYDVVFIGMGFEPLLAAALLAKRGFRVLLLGQGSLAPAYDAAGRRWPRAPHTFLGSQSPVARRVLAELALHQLFRRRATSIDPAFQVVMPGHRFEHALDPAALEREVAREFGLVQRAVEDFDRAALRHGQDLDRIADKDLVWPPETFLERREFVRATAHQAFDKQGAGLDPFAELAEDHPFRHVVDAPVRFASRMDPGQLAPLARVRLYDSWCRGAAKLEGGAAWLHEALLEKVVTYSGEVRPRERVDRVLTRRGHATGVRLATTAEEIGAGFVVAGCEVGALLPLLPDRTSFGQLFERIGEPTPRWCRYTLHLVVREEAVPAGMGRDAFFLLDPQRAPAAENLLRVEAHPANDAGERMLSIEALLPRRGVEEVSGYVSSMRERILAVVSELVPFLGDHLLAVDSPHDGREVQDIAGGRLVPPEEPWSRGPQSMPVVHGYPVRGPLGVCGLPVRTPIKRLLLCNEQIVPGLGDEGSFLAAWSAARVVTRSDRKKEWMRRGLWTKVEI